MKTNHSNRQGSTNDLERFIEPLASYICAADQPKAALRAALSLLSNEVRHTNRAACARVATFAASRWS
jgi:hypothetical protein